MRDGWLPGEVVALWYHEEGFPEGFIASYQVEMDNGNLIYAGNDNDSSIRAQLRFAIGEPVECCELGIWHPGRVVAHRALRHLRGYPITKEMAYEVLRDDRRSMVWAPEDDDQYIRRAGAPGGAPLPPRVGPSVAELLEWAGHK